MGRWLRYLALGLLILATVPVGGCTLALCTISIPDFSSKSVDGVWLWRLSATTGTYARDTRFVFADTVLQQAGEMMEYQSAAADGSKPISLTATLVRDPKNPDRVTLQLVFSRTEDAGYYRASTYNVNGDSPLSTEIVPL